MTTDKAAPDCRGCKWFEPANRCWPSGCACPEVATSVALSARLPHGDCGPSGRYFEPKEKEQ
jgi:hypothetical protein